MSSVAVIASSTATGASFTALTVMLRVPISRQATIGDGVIDAIRPIEVSRRGIGITAVGRNRNTATLCGRKSAGHDGQGITIEIGIVGSPDRSVDVKGVSSVAVIASSIATGASFTAFTVMFKVPISRQATIGDGVIDAIRPVEVSAGV